MDTSRGLNSILSRALYILYICYGPIRNFWTASKLAGPFQSRLAGLEAASFFPSRIGSTRFEAGWPASKQAASFLNPLRIGSTHFKAGRPASKQARLQIGP